MAKNISFEELEQSKERRWRLGEEALNSGDASGALFIFKALAKEGEPYAMLYVASIYDDGENGVEQDYKQARIWYEKAFLNGAESKIASFRLGCIYYKGGLGVKVDYKKAFSCFSAIEHDDQPGALCMLGYMYERGRGVEKNKGKAFEYYKEAAHQGHLLAASSLSKLMMKNKQFIDGLSLFFKTIRRTCKVALKDEKDWRITINLKPESMEPDR